MAKTNKRKRAQAEKRGAAPQATRAPVNRRALLGWSIAGVALAGAAGAWGVTSFNASQAERDLSRIGQGAPAIVQIHDPQCPLCNDLQRETRKALAGLEGEPPVYLVADLTLPEGAAFARDHAAAHVTLLLFDAAGRRVQTIQGPHTRTQLQPMFARLTR
ncbi:hypothetical protein KDD17_02880 [Sulfitobacter albidus]|uniref:Thioredoxin family protein n=1 Tax=Sulfitobacter albidus TaxID=2829501 RepID=A0A975JET6_9RHOB|nr:hypothetical protein [Sulfitobacter albidus]QUJ77007.1 hypothetical protein KDD17_02880 [Sulfitobacter albidus]